jgi:hypothetical protein
VIFFIREVLNLTNDKDPLDEITHHNDLTVALNAKIIDREDVLDTAR